jgi:hypothetical protein
MRKGANERMQVRAIKSGRNMNEMASERARESESERERERSGKR